MTDPTPTTSLAARAKASAAGTRVRQGGEEYLFSIRDEVAELLTGSPFDVDSYLQAAYREVSKSKLLVQAAQQSGDTVLGGVMLGATLQLPIGGPLGQFYLTPRNEGQGQNRRAVCVPMIGYKGFFELGYRSGRVRSFDYLIRREGDTWKQGGNSERGKWFDLEPFAGGEFDENDENGNRRILTGVVALAHLYGEDRPSWQFMSRATIDRRKPRVTNNTPWEGQHAEAMYVKTPHRELAKFMQLSIQSAKAVEADEAIAVWNAHTSSIDTVHEGESVPLSLEAAQGDAPQDGTAAEPGQAAPPAGEPVPIATDSRPGAPEAAQGRTAPRMDPDESADYERRAAEEAAAGR